MPDNMSRNPAGYDSDGQLCSPIPRGPVGLESLETLQSMLDPIAPGPVGGLDGGMCVLPQEGEPMAPSLHSARSIVDQVFADIDGFEELKGAGVILKLPEAPPLQVRESNHASGLDTYVRVTISVRASLTALQQTWWEQWNGVILNCGGAAISWGAVVVSAGAEVPTVGASTPMLIASYLSATATSAQCGLAVAKGSSDDFAEFLQSSDGEWVNTADIVLDVVSLAGGISGAVRAVSSGGKLLKTSRYAAQLEKIPKGKLLKQLKRLEKVESDISYFRNSVSRLVVGGRVSDPASRVFSNNIMKRALPLITKSLKKEMLGGLGDMISGTMATISSGYGGSGAKNLGLVKTTIEVLQSPL